MSGKRRVDEVKLKYCTAYSTYMYREGNETFNMCPALCTYWNYKHMTEKYTHLSALRHIHS